MVEPEGESFRRNSFCPKWRSIFGPPSPLNPDYSGREGRVEHLVKRYIALASQKPWTVLVKFEITSECHTDVTFHPGGFTGILGYDSRDGLRYQTLQYACTWFCIRSPLEGRCMVYSR